MLPQRLLSPIRNTRAGRLSLLNDAAEADDFLLLPLDKVILGGAVGAGLLLVHQAAFFCPFTLAACSLALASSRRNRISF